MIFLQQSCSFSFVSNRNYFENNIHSMYVYYESTNKISHSISHQRPLNLVSTHSKGFPVFSGALFSVSGSGKQTRILKHLFTYATKAASDQQYLTHLLSWPNFCTNIQYLCNCSALFTEQISGAINEHFWNVTLPPKSRLDEC